MSKSAVVVALQIAGIVVVVLGMMHYFAYLFLKTTGDYRFGLGVMFFLLAALAIIVIVILGGEGEIHIGSDDKGKT